MARSRSIGLPGLALALAAMIASTAAPAQTSRQWTVYEEPEYGFRIDVPTSFQAEPPPARPSSESGRVFSALDGRARLLVFGAPRGDASLDELRRGYLEKAGNPRITYTRRFGSSYVMSGFLGDDIFYMKLVLPRGGDAINVMEIRYPREMKRRFDPIVTRLSRSFRRM